jgi:MoxR-like ATPase
LSQTPTQPVTDRESQFIDRFVAAKARLKHELHKVIVGQEEVLELLLAAIFARGHCLLVGCRGWPKP